MIPELKAAIANGMIEIQAREREQAEAEARRIAEHEAMVQERLGAFPEWMRPYGKYERAGNSDYDSDFDLVFSLPECVKAEIWRTSNGFGGYGYKLKVGRYWGEVKFEKDIDFIISEAHQEWEREQARLSEELKFKLRPINIQPDDDEDDDALSVKPIKIDDDGCDDDDEITPSKNAEIAAELRNITSALNRIVELLGES